MAKKLSEPSLKVKKFTGLNNKAEPRTMSPGELVRADNVDIDDRNAVRMRRGHVLALAGSSITAAWASEDESRMFLIDSGELQEFNGEAKLTLASGFSADEAYFADAGDRYYVSCGTRLGIITADGYVDLVVPTPDTPQAVAGPGNLGAGRWLVAAVHRAPDGRQGAASQIQQIILEEDQGLDITIDPVSGFETLVYCSKQNGDQLFYAGVVDGGSVHITNLSQVGGDVLDNAQIMGGEPPVPSGPIAYFGGQLYVTVIDRPSGLSYIFRSEPFWTHLFSAWRDVETIHGQVRMLTAVPEGVIVGTNRSVFALSEGGLTTLAEYGVVPGQTAFLDRATDNVYFWTVEGICRALPFENLTESRLSAPPGDRCFVGLIREGGFGRLVVGTAIADGEGDGTVPSNPRNRWRNQTGNG